MQPDKVGENRSLIRHQPSESSVPSVIGLHIGVKRWLVPVLLLAGALGLSISASQYQRFPGDLPVSEWVQSLSFPVFDEYIEWVSVLGDWTPAAIMTACAVVLLFLFRKRADAVYLAVVIVASTFLNRLVKELVDRPRPDPALLRLTEEASNNSFPSGHTVFACVFFGLLILYLSKWALGPRWPRRGVQVLLLLLILSMGLSRVYVGAHWASDVVGAYLYGALYLSLVLWLEALLRLTWRPFMVHLGPRKG